ncbi:MAG TPA: glycosyltransferase, partial [Thermoanaerobaculia bacterium]|nr:glycosyltransferase [Thermoanaerobaculia bacterium]
RAGAARAGRSAVRRVADRGGALSVAAPRAALVHDWLTGTRGGEKVLEVLCDLFPAAPVYTLFHFPGSVGAAIERHPIRTSFLQRAPGLRRHYRRYLPLFPAAIERFDLSGYDLVVSTSHCVAKGARPAPGAFHLCYCHTPMRYVWDQEHAYFPRRTGPAARLRGLVLARLRAWDVASSPRVHRFVANSSFVAQRIRRYYGRDAEVVHPPVDTDFFTPVEAMGAARRATPGDYCLVVSALAPYKRLEWAIAACEKLGVELRIVGDGPERERLARAAGPRTRLLGRVDGAALRDLYRGALCLLQPGVEDFGIASAEALSCGTPVVALGQGGVLDVVEDGVHGILTTREGDVEELAAAVDRVRRMCFSAMSLRARAEAFSAQRFADRMRSLLLPKPAVSSLVRGSAS